MISDKASLFAVAVVLFCFNSLHMWLSHIVCLYILSVFPLLCYKINDLEKEQINKNKHEFCGYS